MKESLKYEKIDYDSAVKKTQIAEKRLMHKNKRKKEKILFLLIAVVIIVVVMGIVIGVVSNKNSSAALCGKWVYNEYIVYEFDGEGQGCMCLEDTHYAFEYKVSGEKLKLDFENEAVRDCEYSFEIAEGKLRLFGGKGTVGGEYELEFYE